MRTARTLGVPMSVWDAWEQDDRDWYLALDLVEREAEAARCPLCGGPASECQDAANQHAFDTDVRRCYRTKARITALEGRKKDPHAGALIVSSRFNPARRKVKKR